MGRTLKNKKAIFLAYDIGFSTGPFDLTEDFANPEFVVNFASKENFDGITMTPGLFLKHISLLKKKAMPVIVKINGLTSLTGKDNLDYYGPLLFNLDKIVKNNQLGAFGFNLYLGSKNESKSLEDLGKVVAIAKDNLKSVIVWPKIFPSSTFWHHNENLAIAYGVRAAMEMGADAAVLPWPQNRKHFDIIAKMTPGFSLFLTEESFDGIENIDEVLVIIKDFFAEGGKGIFLNPKTIELYGKEDFINKIKNIIRH